MQKRFIALALALLFALTLFAACGGDSDSDGDSDGGGEGSAQAAQVGGIIQFGGYDWRVLDIQDGKALILSENILTERAYHSSYENVTWAECELREYLNGEFYDSFTADEKAMIAETRITNNDNPWYGTPGGNSTADRIFLLSIEEVVKYCGDSGQVSNRPSDTYRIDDEYNDARIAYDAQGAASWWWLRSPGGFSDNAAGVDRDGTLLVIGDQADYSASGVRPALWLEL